MLGDIYDIVSNPQVLFATFSAIAVFATILTASTMLFQRDCSCTMRARAADCSKWHLGSRSPEA